MRYGTDRRSRAMLATSAPTTAVVARRRAADFSGARTSAILRVLEQEQQIPRFDHGPRLRVYFGDASVARAVDRRFHLHRFDRQQTLAGLDRLTHAHRDR